MALFKIWWDSLGGRGNVDFPSPLLTPQLLFSRLNDGIFLINKNNLV